MGDHLVKTLSIPEYSRPVRIGKKGRWFGVHCVDYTLDNQARFVGSVLCLLKWKTSMHTQIPLDSPVGSPDGPPPIHPTLSQAPSPPSAQHRPFHHLNPNERALSGLKRRPVRVISRSKFKWTVCVSIGCQWNASSYIMSTRRVVLLLLEIHFRGPAGAPGCLGVEGVWGLEVLGELSSNCDDCFLFNG